MSHTQTTSTNPASAHIPKSGALLGITIAALIFAIVELGIFAYLEAAYNQALANITSVLSAALGFGLLSSIFTIIFVVYFLVTTLRVYSGYNKIAVPVLAVAASVFWLITWTLLSKIVSLLSGTVRVLTLNSLGNIVPVNRPVASQTSKGLYGTLLALALVEWFLFIALVILLALGARRSRATATKATTTTPDHNHVVAPGTNIELTHQNGPTETLPPSTHAATPAQHQQV